ncbi:MAG: MBL fold metallo-hydrolase, partial [Deltaproteobacteria bacterium]|nr:MBL fold metallo-hydrolase [Deltaproteobacteria bacterium]
MQSLKVGDISVARVVEMEGPTRPDFFYAAAPPELFLPHLEWLAPWSYSPETHRMNTSVHTYVL